MIGGNQIESAVDQALEQCRVVRLGAQRRVHLIVGVVVADVVFAENQVVWCHLGGDLHIAALFPPADRFHADLARNMLDVNVRTGRVRETNVAVDDDLFGTCRRSLDAKAVTHRAFVERAWSCKLGNFAVACKKHAHFPRILHRAEQHRCVSRRVAIVGEHLHPQRAHAIDTRQLLAFAPFSDTAGSIDWDARIFCSDGKHLTNHRRRVDRRHGVGHHHHAGDATIDRCLGSGRDVFLRLKSWFAKMHMRIKHSGHQNPLLGIDHAAIIGRLDPLAYFANHTAFDQYIAMRQVRTFFRGDAGVLDEEVHGFLIDVDTSLIMSRTRHRA